MQSYRSAQQRNDFRARLHAVDPEKWHLVRGLATVDGEVASIHAEAEGDGVKFAEFDAAAGDFLDRCDDPAANQLLKGIRGGVPAECTECNQAEYAKQQKQFPQCAPALGRRELARSMVQLPGRLLGPLLGQGVRSPVLDSGVKMWLPERRLASHTESSSFIFRSASKSLIRPKTSGNGAPRPLAR